MFAISQMGEIYLHSIKKRHLYLLIFFPNSGCGWHPRDVHRDGHRGQEKPEHSQVPVPVLHRVHDPGDCAVLLHELHGTHQPGQGFPHQSLHRHSWLGIRNFQVS